MHIFEGENNHNPWIPLEFRQFATERPAQGTMHLDARPPRKGAELLENYWELEPDRTMASPSEQWQAHQIFYMIFDRLHDPN